MNEESIFAAALEKKSPAERQAFLDESCGGNAALRAQVEELLSASAAAGSFFEHPPAGLDVTVDAAAHDTHKSANWDGSLTFLKPCGKSGRIGKLVGNAGEYEIIEVVGSGGMGIVLRAFDTKLSRVVAVKVLAPELARNPTAVKRFLREAKAAAAVVHDHVVTIHNVEETHQPPFLVMQFVDGQTLQQKIDQRGALELKEILRIGCQAAAGLAAAHKHGLVHRDVKPANILLENGVERVKITDFGLARAADDVEITQTGLIAGTPQYMSPEQAKGEPLDARSDLFSLGSVLYTMCTGRPAFRADTTMGVIRRVCDDQPRPIREVNAEVPPWLEGIVGKLLAKNLDERFQTAAEVSELLGQCLAHVQNPASVPLPGSCLTAVPSVAKEVKPVPFAARRRKFPLAIAVALLVVCLPMAALVALVVASFAARYFHTHSAQEEAVLTLLVPGPSVDVTYNGDKIAVTDRGNATVHVPPGTYEIRTMKGGKVASFDLHTLRRSEQFSRKISADADAVHINGPLHPDDVLQRLKDGGGPAFPAKGPWVSLFNGQDLTGWKTHPDQPGNWKVDAGGILVGTGPGSHLFSERGDYQDFHLRVEAKINGSGANGGVWFRTSYGFPRKLDWGMGIPDGYEAEIYSGPATWKTGSLTRIQSWTRDLIKPNEWFTLEVIAEGKRIRLKVNGVTTVDTEDASGPARGHLALQVLYDNTVLQVRKAEIRELAEKPQPASDRFEPLFNGRDLAGWERHGGKSSTWTVQEGVLRGGGSESYLVSTQWLENFQLKADMRISPGGEWVFWFRTDSTELRPNRSPRGLGARFTFVGQTNDVEGHMRMRVDLTQDARVIATNILNVKPHDWFPIELTVDQRKVDLQMPGGSVGASELDTNLPAGPIAIQISNRNSMLEFRKIEVKDLPPDPELEGEWVAISGQRDGNEMPADEVASCRVVFRGRSMQGFVHKQFGETTYSAYKHADPKGIVIAQSPTHMAMHGIYKIDGDTLTLCIAPTAQPRPTEFASRGGTDQRLLVLKRQTADGFMSLFNGDDLSGWKKQPDQPGNWRVENQTLIGEGHSHLFSQRTDYEDFHLRAEFKINDGGDGGICFRCDPTTTSDKYPRSYEAQINATYQPSPRTGSLQDANSNYIYGKDPLVPPDTWQTLEVIAQGNHIVLKVNDQTTLDWKDPQPKLSRGPLALQVYGEKAVIQFRKIEIKELPGGAAVAAVPPGDKPAASDDDGFVSLFNKSDLTGWWSRQEWMVRDGVLTHQPGVVESNLRTVRTDLENFHLRAEVRINGAGAAGIAFRNPEDGYGYEAVIRNLEPNPNKTGGLLHPDGEERFEEIITYPNNWFVYEIIVSGNRMTLKVNGRTTAEWTDVAARHTSGSIALRQYGEATLVEFRKIEIKEIPGGQPALMAQPFVILANDGNSEQNFTSLAEAVAAAQSGDTIEIRGNGPYEVSAIQIRGIPLCVRAGKGFRPIIRMNEDEVAKGHALLTTNAPLMLEGLDFVRATSKPTPLLDPMLSIVVSRGAPFFAANCRFENKPSQNCIFAAGSPMCRLQNCEFVLRAGGWSSAVTWYCPSGGRMTMDNCLQPAGGAGTVVGYTQPVREGAAVRLSHNTLLADYSFALSVETNADLSAADPASPAIVVDASENVFDSQLAAFLVGSPQKLTNLPGKELLPALIRWNDQRNVYPQDVVATQFGAGSGLATESLPGLKTLEEWKQFWNAPSDGFLAGQIRYEGSALVIPSDFRLAETSAGKRAGAAGKDLGANMDLVGPGAAYERWKESAAYAQWRKETDRVLARVHSASSPSAPPAIAPFGPTAARQHQEAWAKHLGTAVEETNSLGIKLRLIPPGEYDRGSSDEELARWRKIGEQNQLDQFFLDMLATEGPQHRVTISKPFYMGATEVTVGQFRQFVEAKNYKTTAETDGKGGAVFKDRALANRPELNWNNPGINQDSDRHPVTQVSWDDAQAFCRWLSEKEGRTYRLPTEAEWEYACRAGTTTSFSTGDTIPIRFVEDARYVGGTFPVDLFPANPFGLYGMHTNVMEWCSDWWREGAYADLPARVVDPQGPPEGIDRVQRGGAWGDVDCYQRSAMRRGIKPHLPHAGCGFRVVMEVKSNGDAANASPPALSTSVWGEIKDGWQVGIGLKEGKLRYKAGEPVELELKIRNATDAEKTIEIDRPEESDVWIIGRGELSLRLFGGQKEKLTLAPRQEKVIAIAPNPSGESIAPFPREQKVAAATNPQITTDGLASGFYRVKFTTSLAGAKQELGGPNFGFNFDDAGAPPSLTKGRTPAEGPANNPELKDVVWGEPVMGLSVGVRPVGGKQRGVPTLEVYLWNTTVASPSVMHLDHHPLDWQIVVRDGAGNEFRSDAILTGPKRLSRSDLEPGEVVLLGNATLNRNWTTAERAPRGKLPPGSYTLTTTFDCRRLDYSQFSLRITSGEAAVEIK